MRQQVIGILAVLLCAMLIGIALVKYSTSASQSGAQPGTSHPTAAVPPRTPDAKPTAGENNLSSPPGGRQIPSRSANANTQPELSASGKILSDALVKLLTPATATKADWQKLRVTSRVISGSAISYWVLTHMRPVLEADTNTTAFHTRATNRRNADGSIVTTLWSNKILNTLEIDWSKGAVARKDLSIEKGPTFAEMHADQHSLGSPSVAFGTMPPKRDKNYISIKLANPDGSEKQRKWIEYDHTGYIKIPAFLSNDYLVGAMPKVNGSTMLLERIMLLDVVEGKLLHEIELPPGAASGDPNFILDQGNDVLLVTQFGLDWLMAIDLRNYAQKAKASGK